MNELLFMLSENTAGLIITLAVIVICFVWLLLATLGKQKQKAKPGARSEPAGEEKQEIRDALREDLGKGTLTCYAIRPSLGILDITTITKPIGNVLVADASMEEKGPCYWVEEDTEGQCAPYYALETPFESRKSPQWAYFATHWESAKEWWTTPLPWWKSAPMWLTVVVLVMLLMTILVGLG